MKRFWQWFYNECPAYYSIPIICGVFAMAWKVVFG